MGRFLAHRRVGVLQLVQGRLERQGLAAYFEAQRRHRLVEKAVPGAAAGDGFFVEELLDAVFELVGLVEAQVDDPRAVMAEGGVGGECGVDDGVVEAVKFKREEEEVRGGVGELFLHVAIEFGALGVLRVAGVEEGSVGGDLADQLFERLVFGHGAAKAAGCALFGLLLELALPFGLEGFRVGAGAGDVGLELG